MLYFASDHAGFKLKNELFEYFKNKGIEAKDLGPKSFDPDDDYPDYAVPLARKINENPSDRGVLICRNGVGVCIAANRFKNVMAALSWTPKHAASSRNDDDTNILCLPADFVDLDTAIRTVDTWMKTPFSNEERHMRRLEKILKIS